MSVRPTKPTPGGADRIARWVYCRIDNGTSTVGFLARHPVGFYTHSVHKISKPCRHRIEGCPLRCGYCEHEEPRWSGYTPFYSREYRRLFVVLPEDVETSTCEIACGSLVKIGRASDSKASCIVRPDQWRTQPLPKEYVTGDDAIDMVPFLLKMWKDVELSNWHYSVEKDMGPPLRAAAPRGPAVPADQELGMIADQVERRITWPGKGDAGSPGPKLLGDVLDQMPGGNGRPEKR